MRRHQAGRAVAPEGPPRLGVVLVVLTVLGLSAAGLAAGLVSSRAGGGADRRPAAELRRDDGPRATPRRRPVRRERAPDGAGEGSARRPGGPRLRTDFPHLGRAALLVLAEGSDDVEQRALALYLLGATGDPENQPILERFAARGAARLDGYAAQRQLLLHYPESWPAAAGREYAFLAGDGLSEEREWFPSYDGVSRRAPSAWSWYKRERPWGDRAWDPSHPLFPPTAPAAEWQAFLRDYPAFMSTDDAAWHLARALYVEGGSPAGVVTLLDEAMDLPDGDAGALIWAGMRHVLLERASESDLRRLAHRGDLHLPTRYAAHYALGLRQFQRLEFEAAAETFGALPDLATDGDEWSESLRWRDGQPLLRWELCQRLLPLERRWRARRERAGEAEAFVALAGAILDIDDELGRSLGVFEPWLLVDTERDHRPVDYLGPHLVRLRRRSSHPETRAAIEGAMRRLGMLEE